MQITSGFLNSRKIVTPKSDAVRPTLSKTRSAFFDALKSMIDFERASFLDLFSGSGIMSFEAISRGFNEVLSVEKNPKTAKFIKDNYLLLGLEPNIINTDAVKFIKNNDKSYDVIYLDPPFESDLYEKVLNIISENSIYDNAIIVLECKKDKNILLKNFEILKDKLYSDVRILFIKKKFIHDKI